MPQLIVIVQKLMLQEVYDFGAMPKIGLLLDQFALCEWSEDHVVKCVKIPHLICLSHVTILGSYPSPSNACLFYPNITIE